MTKLLLTKQFNNDKVICHFPDDNPMSVVVARDDGADVMQYGEGDIYTYTVKETAEEIQQRHEKELGFKHAIPLRHDY